MTNIGSMKYKFNYISLFMVFLIDDDVYGFVVNFFYSIIEEVYGSNY